MEYIFDKKISFKSVHNQVEKVPSFYWMQGVEDMVIWVMLPEGTTKRDLKVTLKPSEIVVKVTKYLSYKSLFVL